MTGRVDAKLSKNSLGNDSGRTFDGFSMNFDALRGHNRVLSIAVMNNHPKTGGSHWDPPDALRGFNPYTRPWVPGLRGIILRGLPTGHGA